MNNKNSIGTAVVGLLLGLALLFPSIIQFSHLFEPHEHITCEDATTHIHQLEAECELHEFQYSSFDYSIASIFKSFEPCVFKEKNEHITDVHYSNTTTSIRLRGPPLS